MSNLNFLQSKRKSDKSIENILSSEKLDSKTIIKFIVYDFDSNNKENYYNIIFFDYINRKFDININRENDLYYFDITFDSEIEEIFKINDIKYFYTEKIILKKNNNYKSFNTTLYLNEINTFNIFLKDNINQTYSFEILFESYNPNFLPKNFILSNYEFNLFDEFGDKFTKRLNILNINDNSLIKNIIENNLENSFKINYRIENNSKINKIIQSYEKETKLEKKKLENFTKLFNNIKKYENKLTKFLNNQINDNNLLETNETYIEIMNYFDNCFAEYNLKKNPKIFLDNNDKKIIEILKYYVIYEILKIIKKKFNINNPEEFTDLIIVYNSYLEHIKKLNNFINSIKICENLSILNKFYIIRVYTEILIDFLEDENGYDKEFEGKIHFIDENNENDLYSNAIKKTKEIINNINENSLLYKHFKQTNSSFSKIIEETNLNKDQNEIIINEELLLDKKIINDDEDLYLREEYKNELNNYQLIYKDDKYVELLENYTKIIKQNNNLDYNKVNKTEKKKMFLLNDYSEKAQKEFNLPNLIFEISLLNLKKVKDHLLNILNTKFILRINCDNDFRANSQINNGNFIVINDKYILKNNSEVVDENIKKINKRIELYMAPIVLSIFHELNHLKILKKKENIDTSIKYKKILFPTESQSLFEENMKCVESGLIFENNLGNFYIHFLKSLNKSNYELLDHKLWTGENFNELKKKIENKIDNQKKGSKNKKNDTNFFTDNEMYYSNCLSNFKSRRRKLKEIEQDKQPK